MLLLLGVDNIEGQHRPLILTIISLFMYIYAFLFETVSYFSLLRRAPDGRAGRTPRVAQLS